MPEGPEIRQQADRIARALCGKRAEQVWFAFARLGEFADLLRGREVVAVESRGKALLTRFDGGWNVYSHNQLYGRWYVMGRGRLPKTGRQLRFAVHTDTHSALLYSASEIEVLADEELASHAFLSKLGPDVLSANVRPATVRRRLRDARFAGRSLGVLLLDQSFVSGVGNYLRSEILFVAGLRAEVRPKQLGDGQVEALADAIVTIARRSYRSNGITNDPDDNRRLEAEGVPRRERRHFVFGRAGRGCWRCGEEVR
ncbi:MAG: endonuclease VIII, partial [Planctomycetes bacterium]|nr:endonuclease VIII [Planctomycetota bacterium]